jgi:hypothetical protein
MLGNKAPSSSPHRTFALSSYRKELDYLNARKSALDALIQSLEDYNQFRSKPSRSKLHTD